MVLFIFGRNPAWFLLEEVPLFFLDFNSSKYIFYGISSIVSKYLDLGSSTFLFNSSVPYIFYIRIVRIKSTDFFPKLLRTFSGISRKCFWIIGNSSNFSKLIPNIPQLLRKWGTTCSIILMIHSRWKQMMNCHTSSSLSVFPFTLNTSRSSFAHWNL